MRKVKIVCTLGPATVGVEKLTALLKAGMDVARLNFSHGDHRSHREMCAAVRAAAKELGKPIAVMGDLSGPKIRVGEFENGKIELRSGEKVALTAEKIVGTEKRIPQSYAPLRRDVHPGEPIFLDDGLLKIMVDSFKGEDVICTVEIGGILSNHKGMNLPGTRLSTPALTEKDKVDIGFGLELGVDCFALSFVRAAQDIRQAKALAGKIPVIAKIEKNDAVQDLENIIDAADGLMVARGDLGVEVGYEKVPLIQKKIIAAVKSRAKPVITATQMLDSMTHNPDPTRAEVSDVANAVLDGTDAVMLSGETAAGEFPVEAVNTMRRIVREIEVSPYYLAHQPPDPKLTEKTFSNMTADGVAEVSRRMNLSAIAVYTQTGRSAALVSAHRPLANIVAFSPDEKVLRWLSLFWGITPIHGKWVNDFSTIIDQSERELVTRRYVEKGESIAMVFGLQRKEEPFQTNLMGLWIVKDAA